MFVKGAGREGWCGIVTCIRCSDDVPRLLVICTHVGRRFNSLKENRMFQKSSHAIQNFILLANSRAPRSECQSDTHPYMYKIYIYNIGLFSLLSIIILLEKFTKRATSIRIDNDNNHWFITENQFGGNRVARNRVFVATGAHSEQLIGGITIRSRWQSAGERDRRPPCEYAK